MALLTGLGCGRIGFDPTGSDGGDTAGGAGETCASALEIDLARGPVTVDFTTLGASDDYATPGCCEGVPEVVFRVRNPTPLIDVGCTAGGGTYMLFYASPGQCPTTGVSCSGGNCFAGNSGTYDAVDGAYFAVCRDPAAGPATMTFANH
ncbi:MAG: hypothetical protein AB7P03_06920 [Kofleriaceae bacterium]